jgi:hypothetical protein
LHLQRITFLLAHANQWSDSVRRLFTFLVRWARELNWFQQVTSTEGDSSRRDEIITTRLYIFLFGVSILGVFLITTVPQQKTTFVLENPSLAAYEQLQANQSTLTCSCLSLNNPYSTFLSLSQPTLHQVCSSSFVNQTWISAVFGDTRENRSVAHAFLSAHFRLLAAFCLSSQQTLADALKDLGSTQLITATVLPRATLAEQMNSTLTQFYTQAPSVFRRTLSFVLDVTLGNQAMSAYESNWYVTQETYPSVSMMPRYYGTYYITSYSGKLTLCLLRP